MQDQKLLADMQLLARKVVEQAKECFDVTLDFSEESLVDMNQILRRLYEVNVTEPLPEKEQARTTLIFGAYLGEVFRRNVGGDWVKEWHPRIGEFILIKKDETIFMPIEIVYKLLNQEPVDELYLRELAIDAKYLPHVQ